MMKFIRINCTKNNNMPFYLNPDHSLYVYKTGNVMNVVMANDHVLQFSVEDWDKRGYTNEHSIAS